MDTFADRLKELRKQLNATQVKIAKDIGCSEQHYQRLEYGKVIPNATLLVKLADYFNVSTDYLLGRSNGPYYYKIIHHATKLKVDKCKLSKVLETSCKSY